MAEVIEFSHRVLAASESQTLALAGRAKAMMKQGIDVVSLSTGEPDFPTPDCAKQAAVTAIEENFTHYTDSNGILELRETVAEKFRSENGIITASAENVLISTGAKQSIFNALMALCNEGDEVLIPAPYWVSYPAIVTICSAEPVIIPTSAETNFKITAEQLEEHLTPRTKCLILNTPSNPTGVMYTRRELEDIVSVLCRHNCFIISDEIYEKITLSGVEHYSIGSNKNICERVITVNGVAKAYAMTGWRVGFMNGPRSLIREAAKVQSQITSNANSIAQKAALAAIRYAGEDVEKMRKVFVERKELICSLMREIPSVRFCEPDGAFYLWADVSEVLGAGIESSAELCEYLLAKHHLAVVPGEAFGMENYVRFSFAASDETIRTGLERFSNGVRSL